MPSATLRQPIGQLLVADGLMTQDQLDAALSEQRQTGGLLGTVLTRHGVLAEGALIPVLAKQLGLPYLRLQDADVHPDALAKVPAKFASYYTLLPIRFQGRWLEVAISDPLDVRTLDELRLLLDCPVQPVLAGPRDIQEAIQRHYGLGASAVEQLLVDGTHTAAAAPASTAEDISAMAEEASIVSFVNQVILQAVKDRATDIHFEPFDQVMRIRQRIDGVLYEMPIPPNLVKLRQAVVSRIKVMAHLDIAERRLPQDGRIKVRLPVVDRASGGTEVNGNGHANGNGRGTHDGPAAPPLAGPAAGGTGELDLRVSVLPTNFGEGVDIRILSSHMLYDLARLGLVQDHLDILSRFIARPHGIIFVTGPTGSGKTTTLYSCLSKLNSTDSKILTIEDPIEYQLSGITQLQVHPKIGLSFAQGLRSMLRHDPDIMMVGEVRDPETAEITIRSALTGHLVFSTLHTNDSAGGVTRLLDMGIEPYLVASSVLGFIAQRLVRVICPKCKDVVVPDPQLKEQFGVTELPEHLAQGRGCPACKGTGYKGRTAIYEFLVVDDRIQPLILRRASSQEITVAAQAGGMRTLRQDGWLKILQRVTTPHEVLRVT